MVNLLLSGVNVPDDLSGSLYKELRCLIKMFGLIDENSKITVVTKDCFNNEDFIVVYGHNSMEFLPSTDFTPNISFTTNLPTYDIYSFAYTAGSEQLFCPYLALFTNKTRQKDIVQELKNMRLGYPLEVHISGSNIPKHDLGNFYIKVNVSGEHAHLVEEIKFHLKKLGVHLWINKLTDYIPANKMTPEIVMA